MSSREAFSNWLSENLNGEFEKIRWRGGPGDEDAFPELRQAWEAKLGEGGWIGAAWPKSFGGREADLMELVGLNEEYAIHGGPGRAGHIGETLVAPTLIAYGTKWQQETFLEDIRLGRVFWCQGYSEPNAGSDLSNIKTKAVQLDGKWVINGQKIWTSLAHEADWVFVVARAVEGSKGRDGLVFLLVPLDQPGVDIRPIRQISGSAEFNEVYFTDAITTEECLVGEVGNGWDIAMALLGFERGTSTLGQQMLFRNELDELIRRAKQNNAWENPFIKKRIAKAHAGLKIMRFSAFRTLQGGEDGTLRPEALISKIYWATWHRDLGDLAMDVLGYDADLIIDGELDRLQKMYLFSRADTIYAGTNEIQKNIISERALSMPREPRGAK